MPRPNNENEKMSLEDYLQFILSRSTLHLTVAHLNQIISMHGFKKLHRIHKKIISEAVNTLELMEPSRSTLCDYISPPTVNNENVVADMDALGWTDCLVTNIVTLSSFHRHPNDAVNDSNDNHVRLDFLKKSQAPAKKLVQRRRRRTAATKESGDGVDEMAAKKRKSLNSV